jgi:hypothetical protein
MAANTETRRRLSLRRMLVLGAIITLALIYPLLWLRVLSDPRQRTAADFLPFYAAGRISITAGPSEVYDWEAQRQTEDEVLNQTLIQYHAARGQTVTAADLGPPISSSEVNPFPHPPYIIPLLWLLAHLDYLPAFVIWSMLMAGAAAAAAALLRLVPEADG